MHLKRRGSRTGFCIHTVLILSAILISILLQAQGESPWAQTDRRVLRMIEDLGVSGESPVSFARLGDATFFLYKNSDSGKCELRKSDGTPNATELIQEYDEALTGSLVEHNGVLIFAASDSGGDVELWKCGGSSSTTSRVKDINSGAGGSYPENFTLSNGILYFTANDGAGVQLWKTDGSSGGTVKIKTIASLATSPDPLITSLEDVGGTLFFVCNEGAGGRELWKSDGTSGGTVLVKDLDGAASDMWWGGQGLKLDGVDDYAVTDNPSAINLADKSFSWELWARRDSLEHNTLLFQGEEIGHKGLIIWFYNDETIHFSFWGDTISYSQTGDWSGTWTHWAGTYDASTKERKLYLNGNLVATNTASANYTGSGNFYIGQDNDSRYFRGGIDEVRIWGDVRTEQEIQDNYNKRLNGSETGLLALWNFDRTEDLGVNGDGYDDSRDLSPGANHLDLAGGAVIEPLIALSYVDGVTWFAMDDNELGVGPWKSDGTDAGTIPVIKSASSHPTLNPVVFAPAVWASDETQGSVYHTSAGHDQDFTEMEASTGGDLLKADCMSEAVDGLLYVNQVNASGDRVIDKFDPADGSFLGNFITSPAEGQPGWFTSGGMAFSKSENLWYISAGGRIIRYDDAGNYVDVYKEDYPDIHNYTGLAFCDLNGDFAYCNDSDDSHGIGFQRSGGLDFGTWVPVWRNQDVGATGVSGETNFNDDGSIVISSSGLGTQASADSFHYFYTGFENIQADFKVRIDSLSGSNPRCRAGIMIRESAASDSKFMYVSLAGNGDLVLSYRVDDGVAQERVLSGYSAPVWLRLQQQEHDFTAWYSYDGENWNQAFTQYANINQILMAGFAVSSGDNSELCTARFSDFSANCVYLIAPPNHYSWRVDMAAMPVDVAFDVDGKLLSVGREVNGVKFDGVDDYVSVPADDDLAISGDLTIETWIYMDRNDVTHRYLNSSGHIYNMKMYPGGDIDFFQNIAGTGDVSQYFDTNLQARKWHHLALTRDVSSHELKLYVNGFPFETKTYTGDVSTGSDGSLLFGCMEGAHGEFWHGSLREMRIWNTVRTREEIQQAMNSHIHLDQDGLVGCWNMDEGSGTTVKNFSSLSSDGTLVNDPKWSYQGYVTRHDLDSGEKICYFHKLIENPTGVAAHTDLKHFYVSDYESGIHTFNYETGKHETRHVLPFKNALRYNYEAINENANVFQSDVEDRGFVIEGWFYFKDVDNLNMLFEWKNDKDQGACINQGPLYSLAWAAVRDNHVQFLVGTIDCVYTPPIYPEPEHWDSKFYSWNLDTIEAPPLNEWVHLAFRWSGPSTRKLSILKNGEVWIERDADIDSHELVDQNHNQRLTFSDIFGTNRNNLCQEIRIWDENRTDQEIKNGMNNILSVPQDHLSGYWRFDEKEDLGINGGGVDDVRDYSGNGFHMDLCASAELRTPDDIRGLPFQRVMDVWVFEAPAFPAFPKGFAKLAEAIYFAATAQSFGRELWKSTTPDEENYRTKILRDFNKGPEGSGPDNMTLVGDAIYFSGDDGHLGNELCVTDGTADGTAAYRDIYAGGGSSHPSHFRRFGDMIYFSAEDKTHGTETWFIDYAGQTSDYFADVNYGVNSSYPLDHTLQENGSVWLTADDGFNGREIWTTEFSKVIPLDQESDKTSWLKVGEEGDGFGHGLSGIGDFDGDGFEDFAVSVPYHVKSETESVGIVYVIPGAKSGPPVINGNVVDLTKSMQIIGEDAHDKAGISISGAGDFNGDGYSDLIVGVSHADMEDVTQNQGDVYIVFGSSTAIENRDDLFLEFFGKKDGVWISGFPNDFEFTGCSVSGIGNVNGDRNDSTNGSIDDIIIGAWGAGEDDSGSAFIVYGSSSPHEHIDLSSMSHGEGVHIKGFSATHKNLGSSVCGAGDVNGDGYPDILVAADAHTQADPNFEAPIYLIYGPQAHKQDSEGNPAEFPLTLDLSGDPPFGIDWVKLTGVNGHPIDDEHSGTSIAGVGDVNRDGLADFVIGAPGADYDGHIDSGAAYLVYGSFNKIGSNGILDLSQMDVNFDMNNDGKTDGVVITGPSAIPTVGFNFENAYLGYSVGGVGDVNGDGLCDFLLGAPGMDLQQVGEESREKINSGAAFLVYGNRVRIGQGSFMRLLDSDADQVSPFILNESDASLGWCVSGAGYTDGNAVSSFLLGAPAAFKNDKYGNAIMITGENMTDESEILSFLRTGLEGVNQILTAVYGAGMLDDGSQSVPLSRVSFQFFGGKSDSSVSPGSRQSVKLFRYAPPEPSNPDLDWKAAGVHWRINTTRVSDSLQKSRSTIVFHYTDDEVAGLDMNRVRVCQTRDAGITENSCWNQLPSEVNAAEKTITVFRDHARNNLKTDLGGFYALFEIQDTYQLCDEIPIPCNVDLNDVSVAGPKFSFDKYTTITLPVTGGRDMSPAFWHMGSKKLYATAPTNFLVVTWNDADENFVTEQLLRFTMPPETSFQRYVLNSTEIDLTENKRFGGSEWRMSESSLDLAEAEVSSNINVQHKFHPKNGHGRCLLMLTSGSNLIQDPIYFLPVRVITWDEAPWFLDHQPHDIGTPIMDDQLHDDSLGSPYVFFWENAYYNWLEGYYKLDDQGGGPLREGPIYPVNENDLDLCDEDYEDDMVVVYYQKTQKIIEAATENNVSSEMGWGWQSVRYDPAWPANPPKIIIASTNGTGDLSDLGAPFVYYQNLPGLPGYNPNEEHAINLGGTVYALRTDLNILQATDDLEKSSLPYTLICFQDPETLENSMRVYKVEAEGDEFTFNYTGTAGSLIQAPMPLPVLLPGAAYCPNTQPPTNPNGSYDATRRVIENEEDRAVVYQDKNKQHWVSAARADGGTAYLVMRYFYPVEPGFAFPGYAEDDLPDLGECIPWLDKWATANQAHGDHETGEGVPVDVTYEIDWPDEAPELRMGETLVEAKFGLPDITDQVSVRMVYQQSELSNDPAIKSAELGNPTRIVAATLDWQTSQIPDDVNWETRGDKVIFTDLSPLLKPRFWFDPSEKKIKFRGFYVEETTGESYVLPSVMTEREHEALKNISPSLSTNSDWNDALDELRDVAGVSVMTVRKGDDLSGFVDMPENSVYGYVKSVNTDHNTITLLNSLDGVYPYGDYIYCYHCLYRCLGGIPDFCNYIATELYWRYLYHGDKIAIKLANGEVDRIYRRSWDDESYCTDDYDDAGTFKKYDGGYLYLNRPTTQERTYRLIDGAKVLTPDNQVMLLSDLEVHDPIALTFTTQELSGSPTSMDKALSSTGKAEGYVTLAFNDHPDAGDLPVSLEIIKVTCPLYDGEIKVIEPDCVFDEKLTLRHTGDLAGKSSEYVYEWRTLPDPGTGSAPDDPPENWDVWDPDSVSDDADPATPGKQVAGALDTTIEGAGIFTLSDNWFVMRYKKDPALYSDADPVCVNAYSDWTDPMLAEGWIKRVMGRIDPFSQRAVGGGIQSAEDRIEQYQNRTINSIVSMISEAGKRFAGDIALNCITIDKFGLIEIYETVLRRGISLSIDALPPADYAPADHALVLCAGRISDLYMLLGNEALADAMDPTIALGTDHQEFGPAVTSIFCFMDQVETLLDEELGLLRGRSAGEGQINEVQVSPVYNRFFWNFTEDIVGGQVAYALNYDIRDESGNVDGIIDPEDAAILYPQGHGDAWGHYLKAVKVYYELLRHPHYTWTPHAEAVVVAGSPVAVNYLHERKFAEAARARAAAGAEIVNMTYRSKYSGDPQKQWKGYKDDDPDRAWGVYEWGVRAGQGAFFDWVVANAVLPAEDNINEGIQKVDRTTVMELNEIPGSFAEIQARVNNADAGLNPLGLVSNAIPFDIEPARMDPSASFRAETQFDQVYERAMISLQNAVAAFNYANNATQELRKQADDVADFQQAIRDKEFDYKCRLIEVFGMPYPEDLGPGKLYAGDYDGPDYIHFMYADIPRFTGKNEDKISDFKPVEITYTQDKVKDKGETTKEDITVEYNFDVNSHNFKKPSNYTRREAQGEVQNAIADFVLARHKVNEAVEDYENSIDELDALVKLINSRNDLNEKIIKMKRGALAERRTLSAAITVMRSLAISAKKASKTAEMTFDAFEDGVSRNQIMGLSDGGDLFSMLRMTLDEGATISISGIEAAEAGEEIAAEVLTWARDTISESLEVNIEERKLKFEVDKQMFYELKQKIHESESIRNKVMALLESMNQAAAKYEAALARGVRLLEERDRFRQKTAAQVNQYRYKDMGFRIFRNDAVQKYRAMLDLAAMYAYISARAYDYETCFQKDDPRAPGQEFMEEIIKTRSIGIVIDGVPQTAGTSGDPGLADHLARLNANWQVLKPQLGLNNPQIETDQVSLRKELLRLVDGADGDEAWNRQLREWFLDDLSQDADFKRLCIPPSPADPGTTYTESIPEPGFAIPFHTVVIHGRNFFNRELGAGDSAFDSTKFATKIRTVGVWFSHYNDLGLANTARAYLVPAGVDIMRSPTGDGSFRFFNVVDQSLPAPFSLSPGDLEADPEHIPIQDSLNGDFGNIRKYGMLRVYHDDGMDPDQVVTDSRLVCRSVWNTQWKLFIPLRTMGADVETVKESFLYGDNATVGVSDVKLFFHTFAYTGIGSGAAEESEMIENDNQDVREE